MRLLIVLLLVLAIFLVRKGGPCDPPPGDPAPACEPGEPCPVDAPAPPQEGAG